MRAKNHKTYIFLRKMHFFSEQTYRKIKKLEKKTVTGQVYLWQNKKGEYLIRQRSEKGLLNGLWEFPWQESTLSREKHSTITHVFTHFKLTLQIVHNKPPFDVPDGIWIKVQDFDKYPFSTLMKKVIQTIRFKIELSY